MFVNIRGSYLLSEPWLIRELLQGLASVVFLVKVALIQPVGTGWIWVRGSKAESLIPSLHCHPLQSLCFCRTPKIPMLALWLPSAPWTSGLGGELCMDPAF